MGYSAADNLRMKFTGKERDGESGLDYFLARYYSSAQGRFTSVDPLFLELRRLRDPQQLNLYAYTRGNPLKFVDLLGLDITVSGGETDEYLKRLQGSLSSFTVAYNSQNKVVIVDANGKELDKKALKSLEKSLKGFEKELFKAITDEKNHVSIDTGDGKPNEQVFFGAFEGNGKQKLDFADIRLLDAPENRGGYTGEEAIAHETLEAYIGAKNKLGPGSIAYAHGYANSFPGSGGLDPVENTTYAGRTDAKGNLITATTLFMVAKDPSRFIRVTLQFSTPQPLNALPQPANVVKVEKQQ
jgi:RHS repeat-associated protein